MIDWLKKKRTWANLIIIVLMFSTFLELTRVWAENFNVVEGGSWWLVVLSFVAGGLGTVGWYWILSFAFDNRK